MHAIKLQRTDFDWLWQRGETPGNTLAYVDIVGVTGSIPVAPTIAFMDSSRNPTASWWAGLTDQPPTDVLAQSGVLAGTIRVAKRRSSLHPGRTYCCFTRFGIIT
jgi:hypothetical protein